MHMLQLDTQLKMDNSIIQVINNSRIRATNCRNFLFSVLIGHLHQDSSIISNHLDTFKDSSNHFEMYINALTWGSDSQAFQYANNGTSYRLWLREELDKEFYIHQPSAQLREKGALALTYFYAFVNHLQMALTELQQARAVPEQSEDYQKVHKIALQQLLKANQNYTLAIEQLHFIYAITENKRQILRENIAVAQRNNVLVTIDGGIFLLFLIIILSWFFVKKKIINPLVHLADGIQDFGQGNLDTIIPIETKDEIGAVANQFNQMRDHLKQTTVSKDYLDNIIETASNLLIVADPNGNIKEVNRALLENLKYSATELIGKPINLIFADTNNDSFALQIKNLAAKNSLLNVEKNLLTKEGKILPVLFSSSIMRNANSAIQAVVCVAQDISAIKHAEAEKKELQEQIQQAQKLEAIGQLAGGIAHDFNNLLAGILGYSEMLRKTVARTDKSNEWFDGIEKLSKKAAVLTQQLLSFARKGVYERKIISFNDAILEAKNILYHTINKNTQINVKLSEGLWPIEADSSKILQILMNLGINAHEAMPHGGVITFVTENIYVDDEVIKYHPQLSLGDYVRINITDTGKGISKTNLDKIFDPFFTTKPLNQGAGLGLATVYGIMEQHHGYILANSTEGQGATFSLYFPAQKQAKVEKEQPISDEYQDIKINNVILLADDEDYIRDLVSEILQDRGAVIIAARDGSQAVEQYKANQEKIDLVILDIIMPRMDGIKAYHEIKKINPKVKVIFSSGYSEGEDVAELRRLGTVDFIQKPFRADALIKKVIMLLNQK